MNWVGADCVIAVGIIYSLSLGNTLDLDVRVAVLGTLAPARSAGELQSNEHRYPVDAFRGRFRCLYP